MSKKKIGGIVFAVLLLMVIATFTPSFVNQMNKQKLLDQSAADLGEGQTFNDGTTRCLLKDSDGFKCKAGTGYNMNTGAVEKPQNERLDINELRYTTSQTQAQYDEWAALKGDWWKINMLTLSRYVDSGNCDGIMNYVTDVTEYVETHPNEDEERKIRNMKMVQEYQEAYQEICK